MKGIQTLNLPVLLGVVSATQLLFLATVLYVPVMDLCQFDAGASVLNNRVLDDLVFQSKLARVTLFFGSGSLEHARVLKQQGEKVSAYAPGVAEDCFKKALEIELSVYENKVSVPWLRHLDAREAVETTESLCSTLVSYGNLREASDLLRKATRLIADEQLTDMSRVTEQYRGLLRRQGKGAEADKIFSNDAGGSNGFEAHLNARKRIFALAPAEYKKALPQTFLADYQRSMARNFLLNDRIVDAFVYASNCKRINDTLSDSVCKPMDRAVDLAELALIYSQQGDVDNAISTYAECLKLLKREECPDVVFILPQYQGCADVFERSSSKSDADEARQRSSEITAFLARLKSRSPGEDSDWHQPGSIVQARRDGHWWSAVILKVNSDGTSLVHLVGLSESENVCLSANELRKHPDYGIFPAVSSG